MQPNNLRPKELIVGGIVPVTTIDYPEHLSAVIFCQGCCWHCPYCHNSFLIDIGEVIPSAPLWSEVIRFLKQRKGLLDAVVFSGGEPLLQPAIKSAIKEVRQMGFEVALHTNGHNPELLGEVLPDVAWVGLDVKTLFSSYHKAVCASPSDWEKAKKLNFGAKVSRSLDVLQDSNVKFEVRTTLDPRVIDKHELKLLAENLADRGIGTYALQEYRPTDNGPSQPNANQITSFFTDEALQSYIRSLFKNLIIRRA